MELYTYTILYIGLAAGLSFFFFWEEKDMGRSASQASPANNILLFEEKIKLHRVNFTTPIKYSLTRIYI